MAADPLADAMRRLLELGGCACESHFAGHDGRRLHYLTAGSGPPLLLLHGAGGGAANWYRLLGPLASHRRVFVPDLPGFGFSTAIEPRAPLGRQVAAIIAEWLAEIGVDRFDVVGTSFGALVGLRLTELLDVRRIVITDAVGLSRRLPLLLRLATLPGVARLVVAPTRRGTRSLLRNVLTSAPLPAAHEQALINYLYWSARRSDARLLARAFTRFSSIAGQRDVVSVDELRAVAGRLLLVWGERDRFLSVRSVERNCALAGCRPVRIIPGAGHSPNWEQPERLLKVIQEFLSDE